MLMAKSTKKRGEKIRVLPLDSKGIVALTPQSLKFLCCILLDGFDGAAGIEPLLARYRALKRRQKTQTAATL